MAGLEQPVASGLATGGRAALDGLLPELYEELRSLAAAQMRHERPDHTLQPTTLAHEAFLKLAEQAGVQWRGRAHFLAVAAQAMRRILVDHARTRGRQKRGGDRPCAAIDPDEVAAAAPSPHLLALDEAMASLAAFDTVKAQVVEMRYFGGMTTAEVSEVLGISTRSVERHWEIARRWLYLEMKKGDTTFS
jgi:RNA polymerase sigma factor (TIGR02999 family)